MTPPTFRSERLVMRPLRVTDADALHVLYSDADAMTYWSHPPLVDLAATRSQFEERLASTEWLAWAITKAGDDTAIGTLGTHEPRKGVSEIGYSLARECWGRGLAREAVATLIDHLFQNGQRRIFADVDPDNAASNRLLEALGFTLEGRLRGEWETHIGVRDSLIWGRLATDPVPASASPPAPRRARSGR